MKPGSQFFMAGWAAALLLTSGLNAQAQEEARQEPKEETERVEQISAEDREVVEYLEMLKNLDLFDNADMEMLKNLEVLTANE